MVEEIIQKRKIHQHDFHRDSGKLDALECLLAKKTELNRNPWTPQKICLYIQMQQIRAPFQPLNYFHVLTIALKTIYIDGDITSIELEYQKLKHIHWTCWTSLHIQTQVNELQVLNHKFNEKDSESHSVLENSFLFCCVIRACDHHLVKPKFTIAPVFGQYQTTVTHTYQVFMLTEVFPFDPYFKMHVK